MAALMTMLQLTAIVGMALAYPFNSPDDNKFAQVEAAGSCRDQFSPIVFGGHYNLYGCTSSYAGQKCIKGLPGYTCDGKGKECKYLTWTDSSSWGYWSAAICKHRVANYPCYQSGGSYLINCDDIWVSAQANAQQETCSCISDENDNKVCVPKNCDGKVNSQEDSDCFCVQEEDGTKVCYPPDCDYNEQKVYSQQYDEDCFCIKDDMGNMVCAPEDCYYAQQENLMKDMMANAMQYGYHPHVDAS